MSAFSHTILVREHLCSQCRDCVTDLLVVMVVVVVLLLLLLLLLRSRLIGCLALAARLLDCFAACLLTCSAFWLPGCRLASCLAA